ncbi:conserved protein, unknown function [Hepatocystis sp. ex Piliocolobus tephrosceles]|nr:conserved protein, unknown function [Hepatocystis sp. ex Piliocolobus tephrosceles]
MRDNIKSDNYLLKKNEYINDFYNKIIKEQNIKLGETKKTNKTLINLYKKKFANVKYIKEINKNINNVDFLYLNVLIHNKKINYDTLMKEHERNYAYLRKILSELSVTQNEISESEKKEKELVENIEKNNNILNDIDASIIDITNRIDSTNQIANK